MRTQRQTKTPERKLPGAFAMGPVYARAPPPVKYGAAFLAQAAILHKAHRPSIVQYAQIQAVLARRMRGSGPRNGAGVAGLPWCVFCMVGRGLDPAVTVCLMAPFWARDRVWSMRRGGIHAACETLRLSPVAGLYGVYLAW